MKEKFESLRVPSNEQYRPVFYRLNQTADREQLDRLLQEETAIQVFDGSHVQLQELVRTLHPERTFTSDQLHQAALEHLDGVPPHEYGVWVYYPWSRRLVHLLDEKEFALVRTDRNRNKITREEQAILATKKVGIIGLSVGQSVSITLALERSFGEIRLADHDTLELSNLNRIRSGVHQMGVNKAVNVAREIAEIDPFLKVVCFTEGISQQNLDEFIGGTDKLDILVDECDSVEIKIMAREKAKKLGIPVVMDTSDRGLIDVERYDLEPERPIMHGNLHDRDLSVVYAPMSPQQKLDHILAMVGRETLSENMKRSLPEIGRTLVTWPQLGAHVALGGALVAETCRKIFLGSMDWSGRWWIDLDMLLAADRSSVDPGPHISSPGTARKKAPQWK